MLTLKMIKYLGTDEWINECALFKGWGLNLTCNMEQHLCVWYLINEWWALCWKWETMQSTVSANTVVGCTIIIT